MNVSIEFKIYFSLNSFFFISFFFVLWKKKKNEYIGIKGTFLSIFQELKILKKKKWRGERRKKKIEVRIWN